jgi:inosine-uridine nucleoside N-ribohydrolase
MRNAIVVLLLFASASLLAAPPQRVILSSDLSTGLEGGWRQWDDPDDGWAVAMAITEPRLDVRALITVLGNSNVIPETIVAKKLIALSGKPVPVFMGAAVKLDQPLATLNGKPLPRDCWNDGVEAMAGVLRSGPATIVALGPLTDVACLARNEPKLATKITAVAAIMGRAKNEALTLNGKSGLTDFNFVMDDAAARFLLDETSIPLTFLQFDLTKQLLVKADEIAPLAKGSPFDRFLYEGTNTWITKFWEPVFKENGFHPWDNNAVYYTSHPEAFQCASVSYQLVPCSAGKSDPYNRDGGCPGHSATQGTSLDKEAFQLWLGNDLVKPGARKVNTCTAYAPGGEAAYHKAIFAFSRAAGGTAK